MTTERPAALVLYRQQLLWPPPSLKSIAEDQSHNNKQKQMTTSRVGSENTQDDSDDSNDCPIMDLVRILQEKDHKHKLVGQRKFPFGVEGYRNGALHFCSKRFADDHRVTQTALASYLMEACGGRRGKIGIKVQSYTEPNRRRIRFVCAAAKNTSDSCKFTFQVNFLPEFEGAETEVEQGQDSDKEQDENKEGEDASSYEEANGSKPNKKGNGGQKGSWYMKCLKGCFVHTCGLTDDSTRALHCVPLTREEEVSFRREKNMNGSIVTALSSPTTPTKKKSNGATVTSRSLPTRTKINSPSSTNDTTRRPKTKVEALQQFKHVLLLNPKRKRTPTTEDSVPIKKPQTSPFAQQPIPSWMAASGEEDEEEVEIEPDEEEEEVEVESDYSNDEDSPPDFVIGYISKASNTKDSKHKQGDRSASDSPYDEEDKKPKARKKRKDYGTGRKSQNYKKRAPPPPPPPPSGGLPALAAAASLFDAPASHDIENVDAMWNPDAAAARLVTTRELSGSPKLHEREMSFWMQRFNDLKSFQEAHGHCLVPQTYPENQSLANWVKNQRAQYKRLANGNPSNLTPHRVQLLEDLGFLWRVSGSNQGDWQTMYKKLERYRRKHGHCFVNQGSDPKLFKWAAQQRKNYKNRQPGDEFRRTNKNPNSLSEERIDMLERLNFQWTAATPRGERRNQNVWLHRHNELQLFQREHGHCRVPANFPDNPSLASWVQQQRKQYAKYVENQPSQLTPERVQLLKQMGFEWVDPQAHLHAYADATKGADTDSVSSSENPGTTTTTVADNWYTMYNKLKAYHAKYGDSLLIHHRSRVDVALQEWANEQREQYRLYRDNWDWSWLTKEKIARLEEFDFEWDADEVEWMTRYVALGKYVRQYGIGNIPADLLLAENATLWYWVNGQWDHYRDDTLSLRHKDLLDLLGFPWPDDAKALHQLEQQKERKLLF